MTTRKEAAIGSNVYTNAERKLCVRIYNSMYLPIQACVTWLSATVFVAYVVALPFIGSTSFHHFTRTCSGCCNVHVCNSVSDYIATSQATGGFALVWLPVCFVMQNASHHIHLHQWSDISMWTVQISFAIFLTCSITWNSNLHAASVGLFMLSVCMHFAILLAESRIRHYACRIVMGVGILTASAISVMTYATPSDFGKQYPYVFYGTELLCLSCLATFTPLFQLLHSSPEDEFYQPLNNAGLGDSDLRYASYTDTNNFV